MVEWKQPILMKKYFELKEQNESWAEEAQRDEIPKNGPNFCGFQVSFVLFGEDAVVFSLKSDNSISGLTLGCNGGLP